MTLVNINRKNYSQLAPASFDRKLDIFRLAQMGVPNCRRLWADWSAEDADSARLVVLEADRLRREGAKANKSVDAVLNKAEGSKRILKKKRKPKKPAMLTKSEKKAIREQRPENRIMHAFLVSDDPMVREAARALHGQGR